MTDRTTFLTGCTILAISLLISSAVLAWALTNTKAANSAESPSQVGRYQFHVSTPAGSLWRIDTTTGVVKAENSHFPFDEN
jgi:hypothetical protein